MVGVAGRSKACGACYRRRIRCDETRPSCNRCIKARIACPGYKDTSFVSFQAGKTGLQRLKNISTYRKPAKKSLSPIWADSASLRSLSWSQDDLCISYARSHLPEAWCEPGMWRLNHAKDATIASNLQVNLVQYALISLARTLFAYRYKQESLLNEGFGLYRQVLLAVQQSLGESASVHRLDLLEAILALRTFDSLVPYHKGAWIHHSLGIERLLQLRGPHTHKLPQARMLLERARPFVIMACLAQRQSTVLSLENWKTIPWSEQGVVKSSRQRLFDIFVDLPEAVYGRPGSPGVQAEPRSADEIRTLGLSLLRRLQAWRRQWDAENHGRFEVVQEIPAEFELQPLRPRKLAPLSLEHAETLSQYHAICLILLNKAFGTELHSIQCVACTKQHVSSTEAKLHGGYSATEDNYNPNVDQFYHEIVSEACDIASYYWSCAGPKPQPVDVLIPLRHAWLSTRRLNCPMAIWLNNAMKRILSSVRAGLPLFLHSPAAMAVDRSRSSHIQGMAQTQEIGPGGSTYTTSCGEVYSIPAPHPSKLVEAWERCHNNNSSLIISS